jgi:DNA-binding CsgD family transcriptional regulator
MHLLEHQEQLETLNRCFQEARAASGKLVLVAGEAALGKSSLVERFVSEHRRDARTLWGACDGLATPRALAPVHEIAARARALLAVNGAGPLAAIVRRRLRELGARSIPRGPHETTRANPFGITARELEVLQLVAQGRTNAQLAGRLHRSPKTVDHHVSAILEKLGVRSRAEAVAAAFALGIVEVPSHAETQRPS